LKILFKFYFFIGPDPVHSFWAGSNRNQQWRTLHCSYATWTMKTLDVGEQEEEGGGERQGKADLVAALTMAMLVLPPNRMAVPWGAASTASGLSFFHCCLRLSTSVSLSASILSSSCWYRCCCLQWLKMELLWWWWRLTAAVRWCAVAMERKHGDSCGCSSSLLFFYFFLCHIMCFPASLLSSLSLLCLPQKHPPFCNISLWSFPAFSSLFFPLFFFLWFFFSLPVLFFFFFSVFKCSPIFSLFKTFPLLEFSPFSVFIAKRRESPPYLVPSRRRRATRLPYPCKVRWPVVYRACQGMGCINGGRVKGMACVRVLWANGRGGENRKKNWNLLLPHLCTRRGRRGAMLFKTALFRAFFLILSFLKSRK